MCSPKLHSDWKAHFMALYWMISDRLDIDLQQKIALQNHKFQNSLRGRMPPAPPTRCPPLSNFLDPPLLISYQYKATPKIVSTLVSTQGVSWASLWWLEQGRVLAWRQIKLRIVVPSKSWSLKPSPLRISGITIVALLNGSPKTAPSVTIRRRTVLFVASI